MNEIFCKHPHHPYGDFFDSQYWPKLQKEGWVLVEGKVEEDPKVDPVPEQDSLADLRDKAEELGVKVDKRWGASRLMQEIQEAE